MAPHDDVALDVPDDQDAAPLGVMHLLSWHQTYPSAEHGIDATWIEEHVGFMTSPAADAFRRRLLAAQRAEPGGTFYRLARRGEEVIGFVHASRAVRPDGSVDQERDDAATLEALYLLQDHHGTGLADRMMAAALHWLGEQAMRLDVAGYNARAISFYQRHGFRLTGETGLFRGRVPTAAMLRPALKPPAPAPPRSPGRCASHCERRETGRAPRGPTEREAVGDVR